MNTSGDYFFHGAALYICNNTVIYEAFVRNIGIETFGNVFREEMNFAAFLKRCKGSTSYKIIEVSYYY
jgi:hypothetical protein